MVRIGAIGRIGAAQGVRPVRPAGQSGEDPQAGSAAPARALVVVDGGRRESSRGAGAPEGSRANAGFVAQLIVAENPSLRPSRLERTRKAAALYAEAARRLA